MPKIRAIKADFWTDETMVELPSLARLLFIGLWNYACDNGHVEDKPRQIKMRILPADDCDPDELLQLLHDTGRIVRKDGWIFIPKFAKHQRIDRRYFITCDRDDCARPDDAPARPRRKPVEDTTGARSAHDDSPTRPQDGGDGDGDGDVERKGKETPLALTRLEPEPPDTFEEFWQIYDKKVGKKAAQAKYRIALKKPGVTPELLLAAASSYINWQVQEGKHPKYTRDPERWLSGEHWTDERVARQQAPSQSTNMQNHLALVQQLAAEERGERRLGGAS